jgi:hypothetical protein
MGQTSSIFSVKLLKSARGKKELDFFNPWE